MQATTVGSREFRADLVGHIAASSPVAVPRHGAVLGNRVRELIQTHAATVQFFAPVSALLVRDADDWLVLA